jgi:hypothetical protein
MRALLAPFGTSTLLRVSKVPAKLTPGRRRLTARPVPLAARGSVGRIRSKGNRIIWGPWPRRNRPARPVRRDKFLTRCAQKGPAALWEEHAATFSPPSRSLRSKLGSRRAFTRLFEVSRCRFEFSIRRPEAHFGRRGSIATTGVTAGLTAAPVSVAPAGPAGAQSAVQTDASATWIVGYRIDLPITSTYSSTWI